MQNTRYRRCVPVWAPKPVAFARSPSCAHRALCLRPGWTSRSPPLFKRRLAARFFFRRPPYFGACYGAMLTYWRRPTRPPCCGAPFLVGGARRVFSPFSCRHPPHFTFCFEAPDPSSHRSIKTLVLAPTAKETTYAGPTFPLSFGASFSLGATATPTCPPPDSVAASPFRNFARALLGLSASCGWRSSRSPKTADRPRL